MSVLRILTGLLLIPHGTAKLFAWPADMSTPLFSLMGLAGVIELVGGLLLVIGLFTRPTAFIVSGFMAAAYFMAHAPQNFQPILNGGELAILWSFTALYIWVAGPGSWSVDEALTPAARRATA